MNRRSPVLLLLASLAFPLAASGQTFLVNRIVLRINDRIATLRDYQRQLAERRQGILAAEELDDEQRRQLLDRAGRTVMAEMYEELLLLSRADQLGVRVTQAELDSALANMRQRMGLTDDAEYRRSLQASGLTEEALRDRLRRNLLVQEVIGREVQSKIGLEEEELRRVWREQQGEFVVPAAVRLQEIVVLSEGRDPAAVATTAREVHAELAAGATMEEVARKWAATGSTTQVVELGWVERGDLDPTLEAAAWELPDGGLTQPVQGRGGYHLIRLLERREEKVRPFEEVKDLIESRERQRRTAAEYASYVRRLEEQAHIVLKLPPEAEGFRGLEDTGVRSAPGDEAEDPAAAPGVPEEGVPTVDPTDDPDAAPAGAAATDG